jgi:hypothetical protein
MAETMAVGPIAGRVDGTTGEGVFMEQRPVLAS